MTRILTIPLALACAIALAGCPALDIIENKESPYKKGEELRALMTLDEPDVEEIVQVAAVPECVETWRVNRCADGFATDWWSGERI